MSVVKQLVSSLVGATPVALYTWSSGTAEFETCDILNRYTSTVKVDLYLDNNGTNVYLAKSWALAPGDSFSYRGAVPIVSTGQVIKVVSDTASSLDVLGRVTEY